MAAVAPMFALAIIPVIGLVGMAVDYSRANSIKAALQASLDATALAMARLAPTLTAEQLQEKTSAYFTAQFNRPEAKNVSVTTDLHDDRRIDPDASRRSGSVDTTFTRVMGYSLAQRRLVVDHQMGQSAPARRARARHHRLDGERRQDRRDEDRDQEPDRPAQGRRDHQRRRLRVDRSVQPGRQCRLRQLDRGLDRLDRTGKTSRLTSRPTSRATGTRSGRARRARSRTTITASAA